MASPLYTQAHFRVRDDTAGLNVDSGWLEDINTNPPDINVTTANRFRIRFTIDETNDRDGSMSPTLYVDKNTSGYARVDGSSSNVRATGGLPTDGAACDTQLLNDGAAGSFENDGSYDEGDGATPSWTQTKDNFAEFEFCVYIVAADVADGNTLDFRVRDGTSEINAYTNTPRITVTKDPQITDVETDEDISDKETNITVTGINFEASQGTGKLEISDNATYGSGNVVEQTETSWSDTAIDITVVLGALTLGSQHYVWVTTDSALRNVVGFPVIVHRAHAFQMAASSYIAASGENTTRQLEIPSGKIAGDFDGGRIQDDENPGDTVDITLNGFREDEFCIKAVTDAEDGAQYEFRVTIGGEVPDTITVTPKWTVRDPDIEASLKPPQNTLLRM
jgi:hypothetical protein